MNSVSIACPICHGALEIDPVHAGQQVQCPLCHNLLQLPQLHELQAMMGHGAPPMGMPQFGGPQYGAPPMNAPPGFGPPGYAPPMESPPAFAPPAVDYGMPPGGFGAPQPPSNAFAPPPANGFGPQPSYGSPTYGMPPVAPPQPDMFGMPPQNPSTFGSPPVGLPAFSPPAFGFPPAADAGGFGSPPGFAQPAPDRFAPPEVPQGVAVPSFGTFPPAGTIPMGSIPVGSVPMELPAAAITPATFPSMPAAELPPAAEIPSPVPSPTPSIPKEGHVAINCPRCSGELMVPFTAGGRAISCSHCKKPMKLPSSKSLHKMAKKATARREGKLESLSESKAPAAEMPPSAASAPLPFNVPASLPLSAETLPTSGGWMTPQAEAPAALPRPLMPSMPPANASPESPPTWPGVSAPVHETSWPATSDLPSAAELPISTLSAAELPPPDSLPEPVTPDFWLPAASLPPSAELPSTAQLPPVANVPPTAELPPSAVDLLPPAAPSPEPTPKKKKKKKHHHNVDNLLPPGAEPDAEHSPHPVAETEQPVRTAADALLPPGASDQPLLAPGREQALPEPEKKLAPGEFAPPPGEVPGEGLVTLPTADGKYRTVRVAGKVIGHGDNEVELRKLTPEEKTRRRAIRNVILAIICLSSIAFVGWLMMR